ncbi:MAG: hypothetical protein HKP14_03275 [Bacteroidia bacterium]|nr:hypothetical protein [Bacteroidia bacterium]
MKFSFRVQSLFTYENQESASAEDASMQAMVRRMRLKSKGYIYDPKFEYKLELALSQRDMGSGKDYDQVGSASKVVLDAVMKYHLGNKNQLWFGQTKLPGNRERVISSRDLQFVDRSLVNSKFNIDRDFGVQFRSKQEIGSMPLTLAAAVVTGEGRNIRVDNAKNGLAYVGRVEFYPLGKFTKKGDYYGSDMQREEKAKLAIGATYSFNQNTNRNGQTGNFIVDTLGNVHTDIQSVFVDMMFKYKGWSVMSEYAHKQLPDHVTGFTSGEGFVAQLGYLFDNNYELSGRYTSIDEVKSATSSKQTNEYTLGFSKYIVGHMLKWQTDISYSDVSSSTLGNYRFRFQLEFGI